MRGWSLALVVALALVAGFVIIGSTISGNTSIIAFFMNGAEMSTNSPIGIAEAAVLPLDVKETFRLVEKTGEARDNPSRIKIDSEFVDPDEHCEFCYRIEIEPGSTGKVGAMLKANKLYNLDAANRVTLFARGESGGEDVQFNAAGKYVDGRVGAKTVKQMKYAFTSENMKLNKGWLKYEIDLANADLGDITHGFGFEVGKSNLKTSGKPIVIYLKGITFDDLPTKKAMRALTNSTTG